MVILEKKIAGVSQIALSRFTAQALRPVGLHGSVNVLVTDSEAIRELNRKFRKKNKATDVLSFPAASARNTSEEQLAGEIAISADIALENAARLGHTGTEEIKILILHGLLHLAGFDHERDNGEMARREEKLRRKLRLPAGLIARAAATEPAVGGTRKRSSRSRA